jgi:hypothetical protein
MNNNINTIQQASTVMAEGVVKQVESTYDRFENVRQVFFYTTFKLKALFDKVGAIFMDVYHTLVSVFDFTNVLLSIPALIMKMVYGIFMIGLVVCIVCIVLLVLFSVLSFAFQTMGITYISLGALPFMQYLIPIGTFMLSFATYIRATFVSAYALGLAFMISLTAIYGALAVPLKNAYDRADKNSYCCFDKETLLPTVSGITEIQDISLGCVLQGGHKVLGKLIVRSDIPDWYIYKKRDYVCANHIVREGGQLIRVKDSIHSKFIGSHDPVRICLVTLGHRIPTINGMFLDFQETGCSKLLVHRALEVLTKLNGVLYFNEDLINPKYELGELSLGLYSNTNIVTKSGIKKISEIEIGDELENDNIVKGKYIVLLKGATGIYYKDCWFSCNQVLKVNDTWLKSYMIKDTQIYEKFQEEAGYHLITSKGSFVIDNGIIVRDITEIEEIV